MRTYIVILSSLCAVLALERPLPFQKRFKRDASGALDIVTNNAQPIHADVKVENLAAEGGSSTTISSAVSSTSVTEKPCPKPYVPSSIEMGTVFQLPAENSTTISAGDNSTVTPPKDVMVINEKKYVAKSARKSWPLTSRLDMIRSVSRIVTLIVMIISGVLELYPLVQHILSL